jgi:type I restriction enzyme M protein
MTGEPYAGKPPVRFGGRGGPKGPSLPLSRYRDVPGLCKAATIAEIEAQGWSLNAGRYVGVQQGEEQTDGEFCRHWNSLHEDLQTLNAEAARLVSRICANRTLLAGGS